MMEPIALGDGYLQDRHQRAEIAQAQRWMNLVVEALPKTVASIEFSSLPGRIKDDGLYGKASQAQLDFIRDALGFDATRGLPLTQETVYIVGAITGQEWDLKREQFAGLEDADTYDGLKVLTRSQWGARAYRGRTSRLGTVRGLVIHHTAGHGFPQDVEQGIKEVRSIQRLHQVSNGWADIGYHLCLGQDGTWYQGRPWRGATTFLEAVEESAWALGSHVRRKNSGRIGLSVMGWFHHPKEHVMSQAAKESLEAMVDLLMDTYELPASRLTGHRQLGSTACPGDNLYPLVERMRATLA